MGDVKNVIGYLCKYLNLLLEWTDTELAFKPEYIRLAKYNKTDQNVVQHLWRLLAELIYPKCDYVNKRITQIDKVKLNFAYHKYRGVDFYLLSDDDSGGGSGGDGEQIELEDGGSRELLLAFAWLISNTDVLKSLVGQRISKSSINSEFPPHSSSSSRSDSQLDLGGAIGARESLEYITVLMGKINTNMKIKSECDKQIIVNMKKIHADTKYDLDIPHLSVNDVHMANNPELQRHFLEDNQMVINLLEAKTKWEDTQSIFWKWMVTVLDEKIASNQIAYKSLQRQENANEILLKFLDLLKTEVHVVGHQTEQRLGSDSEGMIQKESKFHSCGLIQQRHVYRNEKVVKRTVQSDTALTEPNSTKNDECEQLIEYWHSLDKSFHSLSTVASKSVLTLTAKLNGLLADNEMASV